MIELTRGSNWRLTECRTAAAAVAASLMMLTLAGCKNGGATASPSSSSGAATTGANAAAMSETSLPAPKKLETFEAFSSLGYRPEWIGYSVMPRGRRVQFVDVFEDIVVVQETGNSVTVMEASTGSNRWTLTLGAPLTKFVGNIRNTDGDLLCSSQGEVFVVDSTTGVLKDRQRLAVITNTPPVLIGSILIYGCPTGEVLGHNLISGYKLWGNKLDGSITAHPVQIGDSVGAVSQNGEVIILNPQTGSGIGRGRIYGGMATNPVADDSSMYIAGLDQSIWAFHQMSNQPTWRVRTEQPIREQPTYHDGRLYVSIPNDGLACLDSASGRRIWTSSKLYGEVVALRDGKLLVWEGDGIASVLDIERGDVLNRLELPGIERLVTDTFVDGNLYTVRPSGEIAKYSPRR